MQTPPSIVPEWYLLPFYAILRSIPSKIIGVVAMFGSLLILLAMPILDTCRIRGNQFRPLSRFAFWLFVVDFLLLLWIGYLGFDMYLEQNYLLSFDTATSIRVFSRFPTTTMDWCTTSIRVFSRIPTPGTTAKKYTK